MYEPVGLNYGPRFAWVKDGATDAQTRAQMYACADRSGGASEGIATAATIPIVGLAVLLAGGSTMVDEEAQRHVCMREAGYKLINLRTGRQMRSEGWGLEEVPEAP